MTGRGKIPASFKDLMGQKFTRLSVLSRAPSDSNGNARWHCQCDCGNVTISSGFTLRNGEAKSCGCLTTDQLRARITKHQMCGTPEYNSWSDMIQRCENPKNLRYKHYGERGIKVCKRWHKFANFIADMGRKPSPDHTIDRIKNNGNYSPKNCRWLTRREQNHNTSRNRYVTYKGKRLSLTQAVELSTSGISRSSVFSRLDRGWSVKDALDTPPNKKIWTHIRYRSRKPLSKRKASG